MNKDALRARMETIKSFIQDADAEIRGGKMVNLGSLDRDVADICDRVVRLNAPDALELQPLMADMIGELERLSMSLRDYRDNLKN